MSHPERKFHPDLPKYKHLTQGTNLEICEQVCKSSFEYISVGSEFQEAEQVEIHYKVFDCEQETCLPEGFR